MNMKNKIIAVVLLSCVTTANAEFLSGNRLLQLMQGTETEHTFALGYVAGAFDVGMGVTHCPPQNVTVKQVLDMTKQLLERAPQYRENSADSFVVAATKAAWPCKPQQQPGKQV